MKNTAKSAILAAALFAFACAGKTIPEPVMPEAEPVKSVTSEGSLWPGENVKSGMFSDSKAFRIGDLIVVYIIENTKAVNQTGASTSRATTNTAGLNTSGIPTTIGVQGGENFAGQGNNSRSDALTSTISAMVSDVYPNGNMKVYGRRKLRINNEEQYVSVSGIIRPEDVNFDNTIISTKIANVDIAYDGIGDLNDSNRSNWLGRVLHVIWPF
jgi:flagellar L-ring protein precursor FlgH